MSFSVEQLQRSFELLDSDQRGFVTQTDVDLFCRVALDHLAPAEVRGLLKAMDPDGKNAITSEVFCDIVSRRQLQPGSLEEAWHAFRLLDRSQSGAVTAADMAAVCDGDVADYEKTLGVLCGKGSIDFEQWRQLVL